MRDLADGKVAPAAGEVHRGVVLLVAHGAGHGRVRVGHGEQPLGHVQVALPARERGGKANQLKARRKKKKKRWRQQQLYDKEMMYNDDDDDEWNTRMCARSNLAAGEVDGPVAVGVLGGHLVAAAGLVEPAAHVEVAPKGGKEDARVAVVAQGVDILRRTRHVQPAGHIQRSSLGTAF